MEIIDRSWLTGTEEHVGEWGGGGGAMRYGRIVKQKKRRKKGPDFSAGYVYHRLPQMKLNYL